jgi:tetratricopeptide (TPR) repeat protein
MADEMFNEAKKALRAGQRMRAKDLLTRLIKTDQNNVDYWVWMSASVDTEKEQIFCLQNALKADPNSIAARRGLVLLGALKLEDANLPPPSVLEAIPVTLPGLSSGSGLAGFVSQRRNQQWLLIGGVGLVAVVLIGFMIALSINPYMFTPPKQVVVTSTPTVNIPGTQTQQVIGATQIAVNATQTAVTTRTPQALRPTATNTFEACSLPPNPDPATPLAVYVCATPQATEIPYTADVSNAEDYAKLKKAYSESDWSTILNRAPNALKDAAIKGIPSAHFFIAEAYRHTDQNPDAVKAYGEALKRNERFAAAYWGRALAQLALNRQTDALKDFEQALKADPTFVAVYIDRGVFYALTGDNTKALGDLEAARNLAPNNAVGLAHLAIVSVDADRAQDGYDLAQQAIGMDSGLALAYFARGRALAALGQAAEADRDFQAVVRYVQTEDAALIGPFRASVFYAIGLNKVALNADADAITFFTQGVGAEANYTPLYFARGAAYWRTDQFEAARSDYNTALNQIYRISPDDPRLGEAFLGLGQAFLGLNQTDDAIQNLREAARRLPTSFLARITLGQAQLLDKRYDDAVATFTEALALTSDTGEIAQALYFRAMTHQQAGQLAEAIADLVEAQQLAGSQSAYGATAEAALTQIGPLPTDTPVPSLTPTRTLTPKVTATAKATATPKVTATSNATPTVAATASAAPAVKASPTRTPRVTPTPTRRP